jgi:hypothetical protein
MNLTKILAEMMEDICTYRMMSKKDIHYNSLFPDAKEQREAVLESYKQLGLEAPDEPFPGCNHQFATYGWDMKPFHFDDNNAGLESGKSPDLHMCLTHNPSIAMVVHIPTEDGNVQPYCFPQYQYALTLFRAGNHLHGTVDLTTYLNAMAHEFRMDGHFGFIGNHGPNSSTVGTQQESARRLFLTTYSRHAVMDHAWELRLWNESGLPAYYKEAGAQYKKRDNQRYASVKVTKRVKDKYGLESPFKNESKLAPF